MRSKFLLATALVLTPASHSARAQQQASQEVCTTTQALKDAAEIQTRYVAGNNGAGTLYVKGKLDQATYDSALGRIDKLAKTLRQPDLKAPICAANSAEIFALELAATGELTKQLSGISKLSGPEQGKLMTALQDKKQKLTDAMRPVPKILVVDKLEK